MPEGTLLPHPVTGEGRGEGAARAISVAILAMGGEGGGVLADWVVGMAEANGYIAQSTSVPGVAQRTGATIYYVELFPDLGREPVLALMPVPGDVDVVIASELMEAARAVSRGLVTPDKTTLVASTHRVYSMTERTAMGDGRLDSAPMLDACAKAAHRLVTADMRQLAEDNGSVISAALFGGLAGSGALPFSRAQFEAAIRAGGVGVNSSLAAFAAGFDAAHATAVVATVPVSPEAAEIIAEGVRRLTDYQDADYAAEYQRRLEPLHGTGELLTETARYLALWMSYEDPIRVADLKIRATRFKRVEDEVRLQPGQLLRIREWMHPRLEEIAETLPGGLGRWLLASRVARSVVGRFTRSGRRIETTSIPGFLLLWAVAKGRSWRRGTLRHAAEMTAIDGWMGRIVTLSKTDPAMALEVAQCQRLVKGYSDTIARGRANFNALMDAEPRLTDPASLARLRDAALADDTGGALRAALQQELFSQGP
jgi:indolepyruvate ferredoxin oxidoreductase beta subunit